MTERAATEDDVYHLELRQFPHNVCRFNVLAAELREQVLVPWAQEKWIEFGERKWSPHQATLTVLRGPRIPFGQLTMGRGWRTAQRNGEEVTEELLEGVRRELERGGAGGLAEAARAASPAAQVVSLGESVVPAAGGSDPHSGGSVPQPPTSARRVEELAADSLGLELLGGLGSEPAPLLRAWELAAERNPAATASAALALAEGAVESLLREGLVELVRVAPGSASGTPVADDEAARLVHAASTWARAEPDLLLLRRV